GPETPPVSSVVWAWPAASALSVARAASGSASARNGHAEDERVAIMGSSWCQCLEPKLLDVTPRTRFAGRGVHPDPHDATKRPRRPCARRSESDAARGLG